MTAERSVTQLLDAYRQGDQSAFDQLIPLVFDELHRIAQHHLDRERPDHTLQPTALVNEAYLRLVQADVEYRNRTHFFAVAARIMRRVLVDYARARGRERRGGGLERVSLDEVGLASPARSADLLALDEALDALAALDERKARVVELHYFAGLNQERSAEALGVSVATVERDLRFAKAWLHDRVAS